MKVIFLAILTALSFSALPAASQTTSFIGASQEFILENVKGYSVVEERGLEHEEFDVLVFEDKDRELSFYFTFYRGEKVCNYIKNKAPIASLKQEMDAIKKSFVNVKDHIWENAAGTVQVQLMDMDGIGSIVTKALRN